MQQSEKKEQPNLPNSGSGFSTILSNNPFALQGTVEMQSPLKSQNAISLSEAENLLKESKNLLKAKDYEKAIEAAEKALKRAIEITGDDLSLSIVKYYFNFGDLLVEKYNCTDQNMFGENLKKVMKSNPEKIEKEVEALGLSKEGLKEKDGKNNPLLEEVKSVQKNQEEIIELNKSKTSIGKNIPKEDNSKEKSENNEEDKEDVKEDKKLEENTIPLEEIAFDDELQIDEDNENEEGQIKDPYENEITKEVGKEDENEEVEDIQVAWEHLETARIICEKSLICIDKKKNQDLYVDICKYLSDIHLRLGDILIMAEEKTLEAITEYYKSLDISKQIYSENSRNIAGIYYQIGNAYVQIPGEEKKGLDAFDKSKSILESALCKLTNCILSNNDLDNAKLTVTPFDSLEIKDLKEILTELYDKIADTKAAISEMPKLKEEVKNLSKEKNQANEFDKPKLSGEVKDLGKFKSPSVIEVKKLNEKKSEISEEKQEAKLETLILAKKKC